MQEMNLQTTFCHSPVARASCTHQLFTCQALTTSCGHLIALLTSISRVNMEACVHRSFRSGRHGLVSAISNPMLPPRFKVKVERPLWTSTTSTSTLHTLATKWLHSSLKAPALRFPEKLYSVGLRKTMYVCWPPSLQIQIHMLVTSWSGSGQSFSWAMKNRAQCQPR